MASPIDIPGIRIITVSGRIASGSTTLAKLLARYFGWRHVEGGDVFWEAIREKLGLEVKDTNLRPDEEDILFDKGLKKMLREEKHIVLETKLAAYNAQGIDGIFKILVLCENKEGEDQKEIRLDRLMNRENISVQKAKEEVFDRERNDLAKWRRIYAHGDAKWVYFDKKYYDLVINTFAHNKDQTFQTALRALGIK